MLSSAYYAASWLRHHSLAEIHESAVKLHQRTHFDNVIHSLLMTAVAEV